MIDAKPVNGSQMPQYSAVVLVGSRPPLYHFHGIFLAERASAMVGMVCGGSVNCVAPSGLA
jgi:hypothetical protein